MFQENCIREKKAALAMNIFFDTYPEQHLRLTTRRHLKISHVLIDELFSLQSSWRGFSSHFYQFLRPAKLLTGALNLSPADLKPARCRIPNSL